MKSIKLLLTSVVCLLFSMLFLFAFVTEENPIPGMIGFYGFLAVFLLFFILGWVIKDNPKIPKDKDHQDSNDK